MESNVAELPLSHKLWAWFETNRKQATWGASALVVAGVVIWFFIWQQGETEATAGEALSEALIPPAGTPENRPDAARAYLKVASLYPKTAAGARALLLAAGSLFVEGKYAEAHAQFDRFVRDHRDSPLLGEALLGIAACLDAQGKPNEAITAYKNISDHRQNDPVLLQARFALARLYESQNKPGDALDLFEQINRSDPYGSIGSEAGIRAEELKMKLARLASAQAQPAAPTPSPSLVPPTAPPAFQLQNR
jgi:tetratricopeptide (TPR) repeat protein